MFVRAGDAILNVVRACGVRSVVFVGTGKNVGKTVAMRALYEAAVAASLVPALTSIGRDGEAVDISDAGSKPRLFLQPGTIVATACGALPRTPASEILMLSRERTAAGPLAFARVRSPGYYELIGPPTASGIRRTVGTLLEYAPLAIVDGAIDRVAALSGGHDAVIVSCGAASGATVEEAVDDVRALVLRLRIPAHDGVEPALVIEGALTPSIAAALVRSGEQRAVVVRDATQVVLSGRTAIATLQRLRVRCVHPLNVVAVTVASIGRDRAFEPRGFARAVAEATGLPVFDIYASERAA